jgi:hypothetical protein
MIRMVANNLSNIKKKKGTCNPHATHSYDDQPMNPIGIYMKL